LAVQQSQDCLHASGIIGGRSALAILLSLLGTFLLAAAGAAYLLSCTAQYGPLFHGPAGLCVPVGLPLIFGIAWFV